MGIRAAVVAVILAAVCALAAQPLADSARRASARGDAALPAAGPTAAHAAATPAPATFAGPTGRRPLMRGWTVGARRVTLPFSPGAERIASMRAYDGSVARYRTAFTVATAGDYALRFESVNHHATVWIDGRRAGGHTGAYMPFEVRARLQPGRHSLVVRADWRDPLAMQAAGWHRMWFNYGGINREVTIRRLGPSELDAPGVVTRLRDGAASVAITVRVRNRGAARDVRVSGRLGETPLRFAPVRLAAGRAAWVTARVRIEHPDLWRPGHPALQQLRLEVPGESGYQARVGLREIRWTRSRILLNGRPLQLRGASLHEDAPGRGDALRPPDMDALVARLRELHANATRAQHPLSPALLERLDAAGILVWQGVGPNDKPGGWTGTTPARVREAVGRARLAVLESRAHPSVLTWNLVNEVAYDGAGDSQREYVLRAAHELRRIDPGRPTAVDVWGIRMPAAAGEIHRAVDLIGATNYEGWYANVFASGAALDARIREWLARLHRTFPDKPLVITEFGAEGDGRNPAAAPGGLTFQARLLARHIRLYSQDRRLSGMLAWALEDFALRPNFLGGSVRAQTRAVKLRRGLNQKGLFTYEGRPKPAARLVARMFAPSNLSG